MPLNPKQIKEKLERMVRAWETLAADKTFGGQTLAQFKAAIQASSDRRADVSRLETELEAAQVARDLADAESMRHVQLVVNGVIGDPTEGPDSDLYEAMGYIRKSARKSGLKRGSKGGAKTGDNK